MSNEEKLRTVSSESLGALGAENLIGSGFEGEIPDDEFLPFGMPFEKTEGER